MEGKATGKSQRKRLQRQLEFYLSESNLRQDKFLQQAMDAQGFVPVREFLSFNKLKSLKATERMILDEADKSSTIRVDRARCCIAPKVVPQVGQDHEADARTIYIDSFSAADEHDSLRRTFAKFGKVNLVSLPRFAQSKKFKGFGFVEFSERGAANNAAATSSDADLRGIRVMSKARWTEMKEQLKRQLSTAYADVVKDSTSDKADDASGPDDSTTASGDPVKTIGKNKMKRRRPAAGSGHLHFDDDDGEPNVSDDSTETTKKQKL
ncbi:uncharacterized protein PITG_19167 [Phytophthora infestans T30-4]|uniref:Uncharacterized protein n=1 Tax=Phytophthora infestans (strain T30-4) TaxID=403677 RepID=D0NZ03_PHYIT|nr:uncharacterized protein PITG_19167 [Phytophthora infestans T30-4]EEY68786.1 conserved hypothetical protein [Phytophthora infestans T30-4]KAI9987025.1 hypothetical protein PInf_026131 [Phytophthora infestans]|eukprot:XP_002997478.1 conserved hypothetical protein [Phytophthora infestans T30-4]